MNTSKKLRITGWVLSILIALLLIVGSASGKFTQWEGKSEMFGKLGWDEDVMVKVGIIAWIALGLRQPDVFRLAFGKRLAAKQEGA
ncbi:hypothetical protein [Roseimaritima ulvae]|uniref:Uncharacterized protein n=1 Tax=Roseimaritima ulvae TaxID=980254 RepID=A0A5B9QT35_9BACT|nr:hypothetical protein [Roseimaritima ulvae]QEG40900.1 hypothetical protein UC8_29180 [Roseimaritima ulvae]